MYKWNPEEYQTSSPNQKKWGEELLSRLSFGSMERVLDMGCGDGQITALIAQRVPGGSVIGIDSSADMVELAQKNFPPESHPNLSFQVKDARKLDFTREFDIVFSNATLHWVIDHAPVLEGIKRSLKPSGNILLQMGGKDSAAELVKILASMTREEQWARYFEQFTFPYGFYSPEEYLPWLDAAGFKTKRLELIPKDMTHQGEEGLASWIRTTWLPYTQRVPESSREEFIKEIIERYTRDCPPDGDGVIHVPMIRLEMEAGL